MRHRLRIVSGVVLVCLLAATTAHAWSYKEHILFTRLAVLRILDDPQAPPEMKRWLLEAVGERPTMASLQDFFLNTHVGIKPTGFAGLSRWAYEPDERAMYDKAVVKIAPFGVHERLLHYIDVELFGPGDAPRTYRHDLGAKPAISDIPRDMSDPRFQQAGMLPFRTAQCFEDLVKCIREHRLHAPTLSRQRDQTATFFAGYLSHYLADATQPQHATVDYKSQSYFANPRSSPNVHAEVEYRICDDDVNPYMELRHEYWPLFMTAVEAFQDPVNSDDPWQNSLEVSLRSYDALPLIGLAAMKAAGQDGTPQHPQGPRAATFDTVEFFHFKGTFMSREMSVMEMKAVQTAWAVRRIERFYRLAWQAAIEPAAARPAVRLPPTSLPQG
jgi:hypothetical protein